MNPQAAAAAVQPEPQAAQALAAEGFGWFAHAHTVALPGGGTLPIAHPVFHAGRGPGRPTVLLMHELPGLAQPCVNLARRLVEAHGFEVLMPHLQGPLMRDARWRNAVRLLCISQEFARLRAGTDAPIASWLRSLVQRASAERGGARIGVIGMCLTGAFVLPLVIDPAVPAAVAAQPAVPFWLPGRGSAWRTQLNVSDACLAEARGCVAAGDKRLLAMRFEADALSPPERLARLQAAFGPRLQLRTLATSPLRRAHLGWLKNRLPPHATLTEEYDALGDGAPADDPTRAALAEVVQFLRLHLQPSAAAA